MATHICPRQLGTYLIICRTSSDVVSNVTDIHLVDNLDTGIVYLLRHVLIRLEIVGTMYFMQFSIILHTYEHVVHDI